MILKRFRPYKLGKKCGAFIYDEQQQKYIFRFGTIIARTRNIRYINQTTNNQWFYAFRFEKKKVALVEHDNIMSDCMEVKNE